MGSEPAAASVGPRPASPPKVSDDILARNIFVFAVRLARTVASISFGLWFLAVKTCFGFALEAVYIVLIGNKTSRKDMEQECVRAIGDSAYKGNS